MRTCRNRSAVAEGLQKGAQGHNAKVEKGAASKHTERERMTRRKQERQEK